MPITADQQKCLNTLQGESVTATLDDGTEITITMAEITDEQGNVSQDMLKDKLRSILQK